jgi:TPR repeat protein
MQYGLCLENGRGIGFDQVEAARYYKMSGDQGNAQGQCHYGKCLEHGRGVDRDEVAADHYYLLAASQGVAEAQYLCGHRLLMAHGVDQDLAMAVGYLPSSAENGHTEGELAFAHLLDDGIGLPQDSVRAAKYYELASASSPRACACYGWCLQQGRGVPVNFTEAAELFQRSAEGGDSFGANGIGVCLETGRGIECQRCDSVSYFRQSAKAHNPAGLSNYGICVETGRAGECNAIRAAQLYRLSSELGNADGLNNFGVCLERGLGVKSNFELAADYYLRAAAAGHAEGANNFGFCLEHGRGVEQDIERACEYYKKAWDLGHSEGVLNYRRCLRLLGCWDGGVRSATAEAKPPFEDVPGRAVDRLKFFLDRKSIVESIDNWTIGSEVGRGSISSVRLARDPERCLMRAVKISLDKRGRVYFERERHIQGMLNHPLILGFDGFFESSRPAVIVTEFAGNGSLADHLSSGAIQGAGAVTRHLASPTRIAVIVVGIVLAMRYLHGRGVIHRDLTPWNVLLDWDWMIRLGDFSHSFVQGENVSERGIASVDARYAAPECFYNAPTLESDVFSFGRLLCVLVGGDAKFWDSLTQAQVMKKVVVDGEDPEIAANVRVEIRELIEDCWRWKPRRRPSFEVILSRLKAIDFEIIEGVKSAKVHRFVESVELRERELGIGPS